MNEDIVIPACSGVRLVGFGNLVREAVLTLKRRFQDSVEPFAILVLWLPFPLHPLPLPPLQAPPMGDRRELNRDQD
jgi:hypothetical protein